MNWLDLLIVTVIGISMIKGLFDGMIKQVVSLISLVVAIFFAGRLASFLRDYAILINKAQEVPGYFLTGFCYLFAFCIIIFAFYWAGKLLEKAIEVTPASSLNALAGGLLGAAKSIILLSLIFCLQTVFDPDLHSLSKQSRNESVLFNKVKMVVPFLYPFVRDYFKKEIKMPWEDGKKDPQKIRTIEV